LLATLNEKRDINYVDGRYWVYYRHKDFLSDIPYVGKESLMCGIKLLIARGVIVCKTSEIPTTGSGKRMCWYTFSDALWEILLYHTPPEGMKS
jgi:hypothetical protein